MRLDALTLFGLFAVEAMLVSYALEERSPCWRLRLRVRSVLPTAFYKALGRLVWSRQSGP
jgi:hypothetical protein